jgi:uncharacterized protein
LHTHGTNVGSGERRAKSASLGPPQKPYVRGARLFDAGAFFEAHEAWEERWRVEIDPGARRFLQGLIQIAAAFHKLVVSGSPASTSRLLARGIAKLDRCPDEIAAHGLSGFLDDVHAFELALAAGRFDASSIPKIGR